MLKLGKTISRFNTETYALYLAVRNPGTPMLPKLIALLALVYLFVPVDIVPDIIPLAGWVDDILIDYLLFNTSAKLIPPDIMENCRAEAKVKGKKVLRVIIILFLIGVAIFIALAIAFFKLIMALIERL